MRAQPTALNRWEEIRQAEVASEKLRDWAATERAFLHVHKSELTYPIEVFTAGRGYYFTKEQRTVVDVVTYSGAVMPDILTAEILIAEPNWFRTPGTAGAAIDDIRVVARYDWVADLLQQPRAAPSWRAAQHASNPLEP